MRLKSKSNNDPKEIKSPIINLINVYWYITSFSHCSKSISTKISVNNRS